MKRPERTVANEETLSEMQAKFKEAVDRLAILPGGQSEDVLRSGVYPAFPGVSLVTSVVDTSPVREIDRDKFVYMIEISAVPGDPYSSLETLYVDEENSTTTYFVAGDYYPFFDNPGGVPDEVVQSFLERYKLI